MDKYVVTVRDQSTGNRWSMMFDADDFAHAEEQAEPYLDDKDEITSIEKRITND